jgi:hypothetical protein
MKMHKLGQEKSIRQLSWPPEHEDIAEVDQKAIFEITEKICTDENCHYRQLALRILLHMIASIDGDNKIYIHAGQYAEALKVHYNSLTKCLKYLREIGLLFIEN